MQWIYSFMYLYNGSFYLFIQCIYLFIYAVELFIYLCIYLFIQWMYFYAFIYAVDLFIYLFMQWIYLLIYSYTMLYLSFERCRLQPTSVEPAGCICCWGDPVRDQK